MIAFRIQPGNNLFVSYITTEMEVHGRVRNFRYGVEFQLPMESSEVLKKFTEAVRQFREDLADPEKVKAICDEFDQGLHKTREFDPDGGLL